MGVYAKREAGFQESAKNVIADAIVSFILPGQSTFKVRRIGTFFVADYLYESMINGNATFPKIIDENDTTGIKNMWVEFSINKGIYKGALLWIGNQVGAANIGTMNGFIIAGGGSLLREAFENYS